MKILVTGGSSMVGKHLRKYFPDAVYLSSKDADLTDLRDARRVVCEHRPDWVIHLAAMVGGIVANINDPVSFYEENALMNTNIISACRLFGVDNFTGVASTCVYPDSLPKEFYPLKEEMIHFGPPAKTNYGYGYAKRSMCVHIDTIGGGYHYLIPCNLYSEFEDFEDYENGHFLSVLLGKIKTAEIEGVDTINLIGTGVATRQFLYADDFARAIYECVTLGITENMNVVPTISHTIKDVVNIVLKKTGNTHIKVNWDPTKPDGQLNKNASNEKFLRHFPNFEFKMIGDVVGDIYNKVELTSK